MLNTGAVEAVLDSHDKPNSWCKQAKTFSKTSWFLDAIKLSNAFHSIYTLYCFLSRFEKSELNSSDSRQKLEFDTRLLWHESRPTERENWHFCQESKKTEMFIYECGNPHNLNSGIGSHESYNSVHECRDCFEHRSLQRTKLYGRPINSRFSIVMAPNLNRLTRFGSKEDQGET